MTQRQINYAMAVAGRVSRKHNPPDPYSRIDLFQEIMSRIIKYAKTYPNLTDTGWIGYKMNWIVIDIIREWCGVPQVEYNLFADTRATIDEYPMYEEEILNHLNPRQRIWAQKLVAGYRPGEITKEAGVHSSIIGQTMEFAEKKLREAGYEV